MDRIRWKTAGRRTRLIGTRRWWIPFACGFLAILIVKGHSMAERQRIVVQEDPARWSAAESSPVVPEAGNSASAGQPAVQQSPARKNRSAHLVIQPVPERRGDKLSDYDRLRVSVFLTEENRTETVPIELYVRGVLAGEMPVDFELEALKAQAVAARTYIYRRLLSGDRSGMPEGGGDADVTDTVRHQVYIPLNKLLSRWQGETKIANLEKLNQAVEETKGEVVTYNGEPIQAAFFSTSNGYTENAADYWDVDVPYLRSVASPWDASLSPSYKTTVSMDIGEFSDKLGVSESDVHKMRVLEMTEGDRIKTVAIGKKMFSGREAREKLGLSSSEFTWQIDGDRIEITCYGNGHGVGMSQWGADGMARAGKTAAQILTYYYTGTKLEQASKLPIPAPS